MAALSCDLKVLIEALPPALRTPVLIVMMFTCYGGAAVLQVMDGVWARRRLPVEVCPTVTACVVG